MPDCGHAFVLKSRAMTLGDCPICLKAQLISDAELRRRRGILTPVPECGGVYCEGIYGPGGRLLGYKCSPESGPTCRSFKP